MENTKILITARELYDIQCKIKFLEKRKSEVSKLLEEVSGGSPFELEGFEYKAITRPGSVEYKAIPELASVDLNKYRGKPITYFKLSYTTQFNI